MDTIKLVTTELIAAQAEFGKQYTSYWPIFEHNSIDLNCKLKTERNMSMWFWKNDNRGRGVMIISSADKKDDIAEIQNRISLQHFDGMSFPLQISPAKFKDAGTYTCTMDTITLVTIELITTQVTAIPSHPLAEGDNVCLTCSVSHVSNASRLVWMDNGRGILVKEETFNLPGEGNSSLSLFIPKIGQHNRRWTCLVFKGTMLKIHILYTLEVNEQNKNAYLNYILIPIILVFLLCLMVTIMSCLRKITEPAYEEQRTPNLININSNSEPNTGEIHYASIVFQKRNPGPRPDVQSNLQPSEHNRGASDGNESPIIYGTVIK
ncbi:uncharacterized protein LOC121281411 [Carcharodon carcharias]|uniref:uncharacterized protein LOC121281411 n=1 Tax=Carcharodon carcharias TaxID=13397 RepID=UPI001B7EB93A|nr:uncharacterized protein LOC121281411 [Carcharodon carcharias]